MTKTLRQTNRQSRTDRDTDGCALTRAALLQLIPSEEGSFLLLAEVRSLLQQPVGNAALTNSCKRTETVELPS